MAEVTIGIALYNLENCIEYSLISALNQDFDDIEILVCDDCSTDKSLDIVNNIIKSHPKGDKVRLLSSGTNSGTAVVRNLAIDNAKGKYIMFLDGDDILPSNIVSEFHKKIEETCADIVTGNIMWFEDCQESNYKLFHGRKSSYKPGLIQGEFAIADWLRLNNTEFFLAGLVNKLMRTDFLRENDIRCKPSHSVVEDQYFSFLLQFCVKSIYTVDFVSYYYRQRDESASHISLSEKKMKLYLNIFDDLYQGYQEKKNKLSVKNLPPQLYYLVTFRYLCGFVTQNVMSSEMLTKGQKSYYLNHISVIRSMGFECGDLIRLPNKVFYIALKYKCRYQLLTILMFIIGIIRYSRNLLK